MSYESGQVVNGRYRMLNRLGAGAQGVVFRARDLVTGNEVALKFLGEEKAYDQVNRERIEREALAMARLRGTSSVYVHAFGKSEQGVLYLVMERLHGKTFEQCVGAAALKRVGRKKWQREVDDVLKRLIAALEPDYVVLGGGNADKIDKLPRKVRLGANTNAFEGGFRLWKKGLVKPQGVRR